MSVASSQKTPHKHTSLCINGSRVETVEKLNLSNPNFDTVHFQRGHMPLYLQALLHCACMRSKVHLQISVKPVVVKRSIKILLRFKGKAHLTGLLLHPMHWSASVPHAFDRKHSQFRALMLVFLSFHSPSNVECGYKLLIPSNCMYTDTPLHPSLVFTFLIFPLCLPTQC